MQGKKTLTLEHITALYKKLTGRDPTPEDLEKSKRLLEEHQKVPEAASSQAIRLLARRRAWRPPLRTFTPELCRRNSMLEGIHALSR